MSKKRICFGAAKASSGFTPGRESDAARRTPFPGFQSYLVRLRLPPGEWTEWIEVGGPNPASAAEAAADRIGPDLLNRAGRPDGVYSANPWTGPTILEAELKGGGGPVVLLYRLRAETRVAFLTDGPGTVVREEGRYESKRAEG